MHQDIINQKTPLSAAFLYGISTHPSGGHRVSYCHAYPCMQWKHH